ncbi:uncharacterized protein LOC117540887 isoform X3 [Gymnodraco acuticeps]|uniref:Uncharacterized protein LOC117540887 isoform X3 n=1 Tax=Gymnodraco acuticeps TaxID=8218 RepID=A0A6P8TI81_GYMAC|nr:uncharacterized protein LOC117540887 isoform X3 [Gymnodraco acuticeps]
MQTAVAVLYVNVRKLTFGEFRRNFKKHNIQGSYTFSKVKFKYFSSIFKVHFPAFQASSAGTVFVLKGEDLHLNVTKAVVLEDFDFFSWKCNESSIVRFNSTDKKVYANYTGRLEFPGNNYSVILKNLQEADSGEYTAVVTKLSGGETEATLKIKVQDRASLPLLTVSSVSDSSSSCSFTVTCSSQDSHINSTFTCDNQTCSQEGGERSEGIPDTFLQVHQLSGSIICNHSNHVSWTNTTKIIKDVCYQHVDPQATTILLITLGVCFAILAIIGVLWYLLKRRTSKGASIENPVNDSAQREVRDKVLLLTLPVQQDLQPIRPNNTTDNPVLNVSTSSAPVDCKRSGG